MLPPKMGFEGQTAQQQTQLGDSLWDLHTATSKILEFTTGRTFADFAASDLLRSLTASMLTIIAASLTQIRDHFPEDFTRISQANRLIDLGTQAPILSPEQLWSTVEDLLPTLLEDSRTLLEDWHQA